MVLPDGESEADVTLSFTDDLPETFEKSLVLIFGGAAGAALGSCLREGLQFIVIIIMIICRSALLSAYCDTIADWYMPIISL